MPAVLIDINESSSKRSAAIAKALGYPARIAILKILANRDTCYRLNPDGVKELQSLLSNLSDELIRTCC